jgi:hypothetical protein
VISDIKAGASAANICQDAPKREAILSALVANILSATADMPGLPAPTQTTAEIAAYPVTYVDMAKASQQNPPPYEPNGAIPKENAIVAILTRYGTWILSGALVGLTVAGAALVLSVWCAFLKPLQSALADALVSFGIAALFGASFLYLGAHPWILAIMVGVGIAGFAGWYIWSKMKSAKITQAATDAVAFGQDIKAAAQATVIAMVSGQLPKVETIAADIGKAISTAAVTQDLNGTRQILRDIREALPVTKSDANVTV